MALLDRDIYPEQLTLDRINRSDVQELLNKVKVTTSFPLKEPRKLVSHVDPYTVNYPDKMMGKITVIMRDGEKHSIEKEDYHGFFKRPFDWKDVEKKFFRPRNGILSAADQQEMLTLINNFEGQKVSELMDIIHRVEIQE